MGLQRFRHDLVTEQHNTQEWNCSFYFSFVWNFHTIDIFLSGCTNLHAYLFTSAPTFVICGLFDDSHLKGVRYLIVLIFISLLIKNVEHLFTILLAFSVSLFLIYFNWRLIILKYCNGFCHTLTWISRGCTCVPHLEPPSTSLAIASLTVIPGHQPWAPRLIFKKGALMQKSTCSLTVV